MKLSNTRGLSNTDIDKLTAVLHETSEENVGMASVFAIMQAAQDWLEAKVGLEQGVISRPLAVLLWHGYTVWQLYRDRAMYQCICLLSVCECGQHAEEDPAVVKKRMEEEEERRISAARAQGTAVTPESFAAWKEAFEAEMHASKVAAGEVVEGAAATTRKTGKQFFLDKYGAGADSQVGASELDLEDDEDDADYEVGESEEDEVDPEVEGLDDLDLDDEDDDEFLDQYLADQND